MRQPSTNRPIAQFPPVAAVVVEVVAAGSVALSISATRMQPTNCAFAQAHMSQQPSSSSSDQGKRMWHARHASQHYRAKVRAQRAVLARIDKDRADADEAQSHAPERPAQHPAKSQANTDGLNDGAHTQIQAETTDGERARTWILSRALPARRRSRGSPAAARRRAQRSTAAATAHLPARIRRHLLPPATTAQARRPFAAQRGAAGSTARPAAEPLPTSGSKRPARCCGGPAVRPRPRHRSKQWRQRVGPKPAHEAHARAAAVRCNAATL